MAVYTKLNQKKIEEILSNYSLGKLDSFKGIEEGIENTNYFLSVNKKKFILTIYEKRVQKKGFMGSENKVNKGAFLRPKWLPKWAPEASRNVCTRRSATEAAKNASWGAPRAPPDDFGAIFLPHRYPAHLISPTWAPGSAQLSKKST